MEADQRNIYTGVANKRYLNVQVSRARSYRFIALVWAADFSTHLSAADLSVPLPGHRIVPDCRGRRGAPSFLGARWHHARDLRTAVAPFFL
jgi:hypothetical protein